MEPTIFTFVLAAGILKLFTKVVFEQKIEYIHENPVAANLVKNAFEYRCFKCKIL
jgi:hypothetical protein